MIQVYRAPLRSRNDDIDPQATLARAKMAGVCGFGGVITPPPDDLFSALDSAGQYYGDGFSRRLARFADVFNGSFVWTRDEDRQLWLGMLIGPYFYDRAAAAAEVDLVHVRPCSWRATPVTESTAPAAVVATFDRGGRNFQQIHHPGIVDLTRAIWESAD
ncbi:MAG: GAF domain-containing protein [Mycobacterium sp.]